MNSVRQSCRPKHQVLILKCYPRFQKGVQSVKPNSSELSYLLYYASTRRSKLQKVGAFLEKRAARDVWRGKIGNVQVTLQILAALIEKVPKELALYARSVLTVLDIVLRSREISMVEETVPTFELFCRHQDSAMLTADHEYIIPYRDIVQTYASFASTNTPAATKSPLSPQAVLRWRTVGLKAIKCIVTSELLSTDGPKQLSIVLPVILENLYANGDPGLSPLQEKAKSSERLEREQLRRRRMSISTVQTVDTVEGNGHRETASSSAADADKMAEVEARVLALRCLEKVFAGTNRVQIRLATSLVLTFIARRPPPRYEKGERNTGARGKENWATNLLDVIANWTPVQDRFVILVTLLEALTERPIVDGNFEPHLTLASMMDWLLSSSISLIGLSVMDVLIGLVQFLQSLFLAQDTGNLKLQSPPQTEKSTPASPTNDNEIGYLHPLWAELLELTEKCVGNLATHIYYGDQVSDMIRAIVTRIKPCPVEQCSDNELETDNGNTKQNNSRADHNTESYFSSPIARVTALRATKDILIVANLRGSVSGAGSRNRVPLHVWEGTQWLLRDPNNKVRNTYAAALISWLKLETNKTDLRVPADQTRLSRILNRRDVSDNSERLAKRVVSSASQRENAVMNHASTFLQLLHLTLFDVFSELPTTESDVLLYHLLLVNLVEHMGVNSVRYTLPVLMKLQASFFSSGCSVHASKMLQVGSLVHGYLLTLVEKFNLEGTKVGNEIIQEICKRKTYGVWLNKVQLPPQPLQHIPSPSLADKAPSRQEPDKEFYSPFTSLDDLVSQIEISYNSSYISPPSSPANSPGRSFSISSLGPNTQNFSHSIGGSQLPLYVKEQMLAPWSREACLTAIEKEKAKESSLSGSRTATGALPISITAPVGSRQDRPISTTLPAVCLVGVENARRQSVVEQQTSPTASSRDSTVRVHELRRVLSVIGTAKVRQPSPLRGRQRVDSTASSIESMLSDDLSISDAGTAAVTDRPLSARENLGSARDFNTQPNGNRAPDQSNNRLDAECIPPVPPLPSSLAIPGCFPSGSRSASASNSTSPSPIAADRPSTAPGRQARAPSKSQGSSTATLRQSKSLTRKKSLNASIHERKGSEPNGILDENLHNYSLDCNNIGIAITADTTETAPPAQDCHGTGSDWSRQEASRTLSSGQPVDVDKLLQGLAIRNEMQPNGVGGEAVSAESSHRVAESRRSVHKGKQAHLRPSTADFNPAHSRKADFLSPRSASWNRATGDTRGGIGPPPY
ncbi:plasma membrane localization protein [Ophidiomyces ophidiicola]|uniref:Plasma membrane localization protein n=1 Tax=Ophidiomyces ophidiicola TaxID=1387563 RepID=A0ACB8UWT0_9EURO|nr:plasma membrane localization protein [Ophidiomyces ophidiicola]KAI1931279.1 plasma membrane localization protein [Ophidiomyces ophidiicola]KAI1956728.1 plasma membrane localization protein [Ophidiomyces ophidiicola]KAI1966428.1 plasma membrane localization protein [Ophidiomyces ophidiicola]KAI2031096.1 plasma membrane localization protein [Ophidiomyces ophidiicola]